MRRSGRWFVWAGRCGFGFRVRWVEVQIYWYGWRGDPMTEIECDGGPNCQATEHIEQMEETE